MPDRFGHTWEQVELKRLYTVYKCRRCGGRMVGTFQGLVQTDGPEQCACAHEWRELVDSQFHSDTETDVSCVKCGVSGAKDTKTGDVFWPAT